MKTETHDGFDIITSEITGEKFYSDDTFTLAYVTSEDDDHDSNDRRRYVLEETDRETLLGHFTEAELDAVGKSS